MNDDTRISEKVKSEIEHFAQIITQGFSKPKKKFISQMLFGIQASRDIKLSNIARTLSEDIKLIKTENRLSRNAQGEDLTVQFNEGIIKRAAKRILPDTVIALDLSDIHKPFAKKMDYLADVWNGSEGRVTKGYWLLEATAADIDSETLTPLYSELYSYEANKYESENQKILSAVDLISRAAGKRGIFAIDAGADRKILVG